MVNPFDENLNEVRKLIRAKKRARRVAATRKRLLVSSQILSGITDPERIYTTADFEEFVELAGGDYANVRGTIPFMVEFGMIQRVGWGRYRTPVASDDVAEIHAADAA